jgi:polyhydroxyalkanoate synthesis repressor PhaR
MMTKDDTTAEPQERVIRKYSNRRLYDMVTSSYVTLLHLREMLAEGLSFRVIQAESQEDITHSTLLQILLSVEEDAKNLFPVEALMKLMQCSYSSVWDEQKWKTSLMQFLDAFSEKKDATALKQTEELLM